MADDRVHHHDSPHRDDDELSTPRPSPPSPEKPVPPPPPAGTYVIQIPKDQIYRVPPPENTARFKRLSDRSKPTRACRCCRCFCFTLLIFIILLAIAAGIFYLVVRPESPKYSVDSVSIKGLNLTANAASLLSPEFNITITANNPNDKIGIYYEKDSSVVVYYKDVNLGGGVLPAFYQPRKNVTVFHTLLKGSGIELASSVRSELVSGERSGTVPFKVKVRVPVRIKVGSVKTWTIKVKIDCDLTVNKVTSNSKIVSKDCDYGVDVWF